MIMRSIYRLAIAGCLILACAYFAGCGGALKRGGDSKAEPEELPEVGSDGVDPSKDYFRVPERVPEETGKPGAAKQFDWQVIDSLRRAGTDVDSVNTIYRVQLFASQYYSDAGYEKEVAEDVFEEPVYLVYDVPYYKILMGNCTDRVSGRRLLEHARSLGYDNGWLVESPPDSIYYDFILPPDSLGSADSTVVDGVIDSKQD
jgi:hypothetical protein